MSDAQVERLIKNWGMGREACLLKHAENIVAYSNKRTGEIISYLGIASEAEIERLVATKPAGTKTLEYFRQVGLKGISVRADEVMSIQQSRCYVSQAFSGLNIHPVVFRKDDSSSKSFMSIYGDEMNRFDAIPVTANGNLVWLFSNFDKMVQFASLGKKERIESRLIQALAKEIGGYPDTVQFLTAVAENQVFMDFRQKLTDMGGGREEADDTLQTISQSDAGNDPIISLIVRMLNSAMSEDVNDLSIYPDTKTRGAIVYFRKDQRLIDSKIRLNQEERESVERVLLARSNANPSGGRLRHPVDGKLNFDGRFGQAFLRMSFIPLEDSKMPATSISMRVLPKTTKPISLASLNIHEALQAELRYFAQRKHGLFVVCGPTGSGKSTTIGGMLCEHEQIFGSSMKRVSVEQPCERVLPGVLHIDVSQHRYNDPALDDDTFSMALRCILRHDPDVIFVGEVRDKESCMVSIDSANTGHLVFTTTHANDTVLGYRRLASFLDKDRRFDLVNVLEGILAQRLIPLLCQYCSIEQPFDATDKAEFVRYSENKGVDLTAFHFPTVKRDANPKGCSKCVEGRNGMIPVHGLLTMNPEVRRLLLSESELDWMKAQNASSSQFTLFKGAFDLFSEGRIDRESVLL